MKKYNINDFCGNVAYLRKKHGLSEREMASLLGISIRDLRSVESGIVPTGMGVEILCRMRALFCISTDALLTSLEE